MIIGITGRKKSGKDTIGDYLVNKHNYTRYGFADPLKEGIQRMFGFTNDQIWGDDKEMIDPFWGVSSREILQIAGTELFQFELPKYIPAFQNIGRTIWVKRFEQWYKERYTTDRDVVVSDCRFLHEAEKIREMGGIILKVVRDTTLNEFSDHPSEVEMSKIVPDFVIDNNSTLDELYNNVEFFLQTKLFKEHNHI